MCVTDHNWSAHVAAPASRPDLEIEPPETFLYQNRIFSIYIGE